MDSNIIVAMISLLGTLGGRWDEGSGAGALCYNLNPNFSSSSRDIGGRRSTKCNK